MNLSDLQAKIADAIQDSLNRRLQRIPEFRDQRWYGWPGTQTLSLIAAEEAIHLLVTQSHLRNDAPSLIDAGDLRRTLVWLTKEVRIQALLVDTLRSRARSAESECKELRNRLDEPIAEALKALGWTPPGDDE